MEQTSAFYDCYHSTWLFCQTKLYLTQSHYSASHCSQEPKPQKMLLSGYGVELAIKSTEYKAVDDTKVQGQWLTYQTFCAGPCCV